jgi:hypothetical protein
LAGNFKVVHTFLKHQHTIFALSVNVSKTLIVGGGGHGMLSIFWIPDSYHSSDKDEQIDQEIDTFDRIDNSLDDEEQNFWRSGKKNTQKQSIGTSSQAILTFQPHTAWISGVHFTTSCST